MRRERTPLRVPRNKDLAKRAIDSVPPYEDFMTADELNESAERLAREHGDVAELLEVRASRTGEPIHALKV